MASRALVALQAAKSPKCRRSNEPLGLPEDTALEVGSLQAVGNGNDLDDEARERLHRAPDTAHDAFKYVAARRNAAAASGPLVSFSCDTIRRWRSGKAARRSR